MRRPGQIADKEVEIDRLKRGMASEAEQHAIDVENVLQQIELKRAKNARKAAELNKEIEQLTSSTSRVDGLEALQKETVRGRGPAGHGQPGRLPSRHSSTRAESITRVLRAR